MGKLLLFIVMTVAGFFVGGFPGAVSAAFVAIMIIGLGEPLPRNDDSHNEDEYYGL